MPGTECAECERLYAESDAANRRNVGGQTYAEAHTAALPAIEAGKRLDAHRATHRREGK